MTTIDNSNIAQAKYSKNTNIIYVMNKGKKIEKKSLTNYQN